MRSKMVGFGLNPNGFTEGSQGWRSRHPWIHPQNPCTRNGCQNLFQPFWIIDNSVSLQKAPIFLYKIGPSMMFLLVGNIMPD